MKLESSKFKSSVLATALGLLLGGSAVAASMTAAQAEFLLQRRGYTDISMLDYQGGLWLASATNPDGRRVDVRLDPLTEEVTWSADAGTRTTVTTTTTTRPATPPTRVVERVVEKPVVVERVIERPVVRAPIVVQERVLVPAGGRIGPEVVRAVLADAGYRDIHDIDWLDNLGVWKAEARNVTGDDREIHVDPIDARIVHEEDD